MEPHVFFAGLAEKLRAVKRRSLATQMQISNGTGVDQATISRAMNGKRRRVTEPILRLEKYVDMLLLNDGVSAEVRQAAREFFGRGGSETELIASIEHSANLISGRFP